MNNEAKVKTGNDSIHIHQTSLMVSVILRLVLFTAALFRLRQYTVRFEVLSALGKHA